MSTPDPLRYRHTFNSTSSRNEDQLQHLRKDATVPRKSNSTLNYTQCCLGLQTSVSGKTLIVIPTWTLQSLLPWHQEPHNDSEQTFIVKLKIIWNNLPVECLRCQWVLGSSFPIHHLCWCLTCGEKTVNSWDCATGPRTNDKWKLLQQSEMFLLWSVSFLFIKVTDMSWMWRVAFELKHNTWWHRCFVVPLLSMWVFCVTYLHTIPAAHVKMPLPLHDMFMDDTPDWEAEVGK